MNTLLVTGATGFIGRNLIRDLIFNSQFQRVVCLVRKENDWLTQLKTGIEVVKCDLQNLSQVRAVFEQYNPNTVVHLAANPLVKPDESNPNQIWQDNVLTTNNLISCCNNTKFVFASTITVYGDTKGRMSEYQICKPTSAYALTKLTCEEMLKLGEKQGKVIPVILRICANVGRYSTHGVVHDFIRKIKENQTTLEVLGDKPGSSKPYISVYDTVTAIKRAINYNAPDQRFSGPVNIFNICNSDSLSIENLAQAVLSALQEKRDIKWLGAASNWKGDNPVINGDNYLAKKYLNWEPQFNSYDSVYWGVKEICQVS